MAITKVTSGLISADASSIDLNIDAGTLYLDVSENRVGIGTTSPKTTLNVAANNSGQGPILTLENTDTSLTTNDVVGQIDFYGNDGSTGGTGQKATIQAIAQNSSGTSVGLIFGTSPFPDTTATERMRIDSSGNVGIGTTSPSTPLTVGTFGDTARAATFNGGSILVDGGAASEIIIGDGNVAYMSIQTTDNATAMKIRNFSGNSDLVTIERATGNVGIGTTSPTSYANSQTTLVIQDSTSPAIAWSDTGQARDWFAVAQGSGLYFNYADGGGSGGASNVTDVLVLDNSGNVGIGTSSPATELHVKNSADCTLLLQSGDGSNAEILFGDASDTSRGRIKYLSSDAMTFEVNNLSEKMRIDSSGNLLVGKTASSAATVGCEFRPDGTVISGKASSLSGSLSYLLRSTTADQYQFYVNMAGTISARSTSISSLSDERLKENIINLETGLPEVMALKPRRFDWKDGSDTNVAGFIAQEVETVLPDLIGEWEDDNHKNLKAVKMGDMLPTLVKAIQEQQTIIDNLKTRIETLESA